METEPFATVRGENMENSLKLKGAAVRCEECGGMIAPKELFLRKMVFLGVFDGRRIGKKRQMLLPADILCDKRMCRGCAEKSGFELKKRSYDDYVEGPNGVLIRASKECSMCGRKLTGITGAAVVNEWVSNCPSGPLYRFAQTAECICRECTGRHSGVGQRIFWFGKEMERQRGKDWITQYMRLGGEFLPEFSKPVERGNALEGIILTPGTKKSLELLLCQVRDGEEIKKMGLNTELHPSCPVFNFYGPPGTGKTLAAHRIAKACGFGLEVVTSGSLLNSYIGETEKNILSAFWNAKKKNMLLFFDEADSLLSSRVQAENSGDIAYNSMVNTILKELETHSLPVIFATNFPIAYDAALRRRVLFSVNFELPGKEQQVELFKLLGPKKLGDDVEFELLAGDGLSGGDIRNISYNAIAFALKNGRKAPSQEDYLEAKNLWKEHTKATTRETPVSGRHYA